MYAREDIIDLKKNSTRITVHMANTAKKEDESDTLRLLDNRPLNPVLLRGTIVQWEDRKLVTLKDCTGAIPMEVIEAFPDSTTDLNNLFVTALGNITERDGSRIMIATLVTLHPFPEQTPSIFIPFAAQTPTRLLANHYLRIIDTTDKIHREESVTSPTHRIQRLLSSNKDMLTGLPNPPRKEEIVGMDKLDISCKVADCIYFQERIAQYNTFDCHGDNTASLSKLQAEKARGVSMDDIIWHFKEAIGEEILMLTVQNLESRGYIYSTVDKHHFRYTNTDYDR